MNDINQSNPPPDKLPLRKALLWIFTSVVLISGSSLGALLYYSHIRDAKKLDRAYQIVAIVQTTPDAEGLRTAYLSELLGLSVDFSTNIFVFDAKAAQQKLLSSPVIKEAEITKIRPGAIQVDYIMRKPIAFLGDYTNSAIDIEGVVFPFKPFFSPKKLPEVYLGLVDPIVWGEALHSETMKLAFDLLELSAKYCCDENSNLLRIDVSKAFAPSYGQRQIVMEYEDQASRVVDGHPVYIISQRFIRLAPETYKQQFANYLTLHNHIRKQEKSMPIADAGTIIKAKATLIDLRLSELAFIDNEQ